MRADQALLNRGLVNSRAEAKRLIDDGAILLSGKPLLKASALIEDDALLEVLPSPETEFVSRAGAKLDAVLNEMCVSVAGATCLDLGQSTGGFTDCLLRHCAQHVIGIDVGHQQLHPSLISHQKVLSIEGVNVRHFDLNQDERTSSLAKRISVVVIDLSFISLKLVLPNILAWFKDTEVAPLIIALVKPQFEVGQANLSKKGLVKDPSLFADLEKSLRVQVTDLGWLVSAYLPSRLQGGDGNQEFFLLINKS